MPIVIDKKLPAYTVLTGENINVMDKERAGSQDIRPIEIAILNLMPTKKETETQFMRLLSNSPLQVNITLLHTETYRSKNVEADYLDRFYQPFETVQKRRFDGMIVTGAPVEDLDFSEVGYWDELKRIFDFTTTNVTSSIFICWGAMAALHYFYGIEKVALTKKLFGVFPHYKRESALIDPLMRGVSDEFHMCHSRHSTVTEEALHSVRDLTVLAASPEAGATIAANKSHSRVFVLGHMEYDRDTLQKEYERDKKKGLAIACPKNYFSDGACSKINMNWSSTANLFYNNWLNFVYQTTPYRL